MRKFSWFQTLSKNDSSFQLYKTEQTDIPNIGPHHLLIKVSACLLRGVGLSDPFNNECNEKSLYPLATDIVGRVEKTGESVISFNVGDTVVALIDFSETKQSGCSSYCVVDESCSILKPSSLSNESVLCCFSDLLQIDLMLNFIPKFPIKYCFLISGKALLPLNQLLIHKLLDLECKVIACVDNAEDFQLLNSIFKDLVIIDTNNYNELSVAIMDETCGLGVSAIFHLDDVLDSNYANSLLQCLSFNGTLVMNRTSSFYSKTLLTNADGTNISNKTSSQSPLPLSLFDSFWHKKSAVLHYFNFENTIHCGYFIPSFYEGGKKIFDSLTRKEVLPLNKNVIPFNQLEDFITKENFLNTDTNYKVVVCFSEQSSS